MSIRKKLEQYRMLANEVVNLEKQIVALTTKRITSFDKVQTTDKDHPYITHSSDVIGFTANSDEIKEVVAIYQQRKKEALNKLIEVERFIGSIEDSEIRTIIELKYVKGIQWRDIPAMMGLEGMGTTQLQKLQRFMRTTIEFNA